ncbi:unnamed protein product, partial [Darwinula stevensoni]
AVDALLKLVKDVENGNRDNGTAVQEEEQELTLAEKMKEKCKKIDGFVWQVRRKKVMEDAKNRLAKYEIGKRRSDGGAGKVLMLVGATGAGKSTLINGMVNYVYGVKYEDNFRLKLIVNEVNSRPHMQTMWITAYVLHKQHGFAFPHTLTIIDTPGFGDTEGIKADEELKNQIREFFSNGGNIGVDQLDGICFVVQASLARLTPTQKYIFDSILSVFGRDVEDNIYVLTTFSDSKQPYVLEVIKQAEIPYQNLFKFNNSALYTRNDEDGDDFDRGYWEMGTKSFLRFFKRFLKSKPVSLTLTKEVLKERRRLQTALQGIQPKIIDALGMLEQLRQEHAALKQHEAELGTEGRRLNAQGVVKALINDFNRERVKILDLTKQAHACLQKLDEIALKPDPLGFTDYLDLLIETERREGKIGHVQRIKKHGTVKFVFSSDDFKRDLKQEQSLVILQAASGDKSPSCATVFRSLAEFKSWRMSFEDKPRSGRLPTEVTAVNIPTVEKLFQVDARVRRGEEKAAEDDDCYDELENIRKRYVAFELHLLLLTLSGP